MLLSCQLHQSRLSTLSHEVRHAFLSRPQPVINWYRSGLSSEVSSRLLQTATCLIHRYLSQRTPLAARMAGPMRMSASRYCYYVGLESAVALSDCTHCLAILALVAASKDLFCWRCKACIGNEDTVLDIPSGSFALSVSPPRRGPFLHLSGRLSCRLVSTSHGFTTRANRKRASFCVYVRTTHTTGSQSVSRQGREQQPNRCDVLLLFDLQN